MPGSLTFEDLEYAARHKLALRHLDNAALATQEESNGGRGDAYSLTVPALWVDGKINEHFDQIQSFLAQRIESLGAAIREEFQGLFDNLNRTVGMDEKKRLLVVIFNELLFESLKAYADTRTETHHYLLITHPSADTPYDFGSYPLGKCGTGIFWPASSVHKRFSIDRAVHGSLESCTAQIASILRELRTHNKIQDITQPNSGVWPLIKIGGGIVVVALAAYGIYKKLNPTPQPPTVKKPELETYGIRPE